MFGRGGILLFYLLILIRLYHIFWIFWFLFLDLLLILLLTNFSFIILFIQIWLFLFFHLTFNRQFPLPFFHNNFLRDWWGGFVEEGGGRILVRLLLASRIICYINWPILIKNTRTTHCAFNQAGCEVQLTGIENLNGNPWLIIDVCRDFCNFVNGVHTINNLSENDVLSVKMGALPQSDKKLTCICIRPLICHRKTACLRMPPLKILIHKEITGSVWIDGSATAAVLLVAEIATLYHKLVNYSMKRCAKIVEWFLPGRLLLKLLRILLCIFSSTKSTEIFCCFWCDVVKQFNNDSTSCSRSYCDVEEYSRILRHI